MSTRENSPNTSTTYKCNYKYESWLFTWNKCVSQFPTKSQLERTPHNTHTRSLWVICSIGMLIKLSVRNVECFEHCLKSGWSEFAESNERVWEARDSLEESTTGRSRLILRCWRRALEPLSSIGGEPRPAPGTGIPAPPVVVPDYASSRPAVRANTTPSLPPCNGCGKQQKLLKKKEGTQ